MAAIAGEAKTFNNHLGFERDLWHYQTRFFGTFWNLTQAFCKACALQLGRQSSVQIAVLPPRAIYDHHNRSRILFSCNAQVTLSQHIR